MLATAGPLPTSPGWAYEAKFDGMRALIYTSDDQWRLHTRTGRDATGGFPELAVLPDLVQGRAVVLDGELVSIGPTGVPEFSLMQQRMMSRRPSATLLAAVPVQLYLFDVLHLDGADTLDLSYTRRRQMLESLQLDQATVRTPPTFDEAGADLLAAVAETGLEGVVSKRLTSTYHPGRRSRDWIKTLVPHTARAVIVGWIPGQGRRAGTIGAVLLAAYHAEHLVYLGRAGTGFTDATLRDLTIRLRPLTLAEPAVAGVPGDIARRAKWVEPVLVAQVAYRTVEADGLRHPSWRGLLPGVDPRTVRRPAG